MKKLLYILIFSYCILFIVPPVHAQYVLPYPSYMPGNKIYKITRILDRLENYWFFGKIAQEKYHLKLADKYLVEAKTLFEYKQYLLGVDALIRSDKEFGALPKNARTKEAAAKHLEVLSHIKGIVPEVSTWSPEKSASSDLLLHSNLNTSITLRQLWQ